MLTDSMLHDIIVPTVDTCRTEGLIRIVCDAKAHVLLTGPPGCGKSVTLRSYTRNLDPELFVYRCPAFMVIKAAYNMHTCCFQVHMLEPKSVSLRRFRIQTICKRDWFIVQAIDQACSRLLISARRDDLRLLS
jgi:hypothetical protein